MDGLLINPSEQAPTERFGMPANDFIIERHGSFELYVKAVARNWGYEATCENLDLDVLESEERGYTVNAAGRGTIVMDRDGDGVTLDYHLPEYARHVFADIKAAIKGHDMDRDRRRGRAESLTVRGG